MRENQTPTRKRRGPGRALLRLHRRIGIALSAVFIVVCLTGIVLNHNDDLEFQSRTVKADWVYDWYGLQPSGELRYFPLANGSVSWLDGQLFFGTRTLGAYPEPIGIAELPFANAIAFETDILLVSSDGEIIETLAESTIPGTAIEAIAPRENEALLIKTNSGNFVSDSEILSWSPTNESTFPARGEASQAPVSLQEEIRAAYRGEGITWGRVVLDIHTGRFFGSFGKWIADIGALALIFLTVSGIIYTTRYLNKARARASGSKA